MGVCLDCAFSKPLGLDIPTIFHSLSHRIRTFPFFHRLQFLDSYRRDSGATILFASHDMREVELLCDEVILLRRGKLVERGTPQSLLDKYDHKRLEEVFIQVNRSGSAE